MWINESNRKKHLMGGIVTAFLATILCTAGAAVALEWKDKAYGNKFDWLDLLATMIGGLIGQALQLGVIWLIIK